MERRSPNLIKRRMAPRHAGAVCFGLALTLLTSVPVLAGTDTSGVLVYTLRFTGGAERRAFVYDASTPSLTLGTPVDIWTGAGATGGNPEADGLFFTPDGNLVVAAWVNGEIYKFDPAGTDILVDGPIGVPFANHLFMHPNLADGLSTPFTGHFGCIDEKLNEFPCFGVWDHTPFGVGGACLAPSATGGSSSDLQPVTFSRDSEGNVFVVFSDGRDECSFCPADTGIRHGGGGFAAFDLDTTSSSTGCSGSMSMTVLIDQEIPAAHSMAYDPFLSDPTHPSSPHSDFLLFANKTIQQIRVTDPGTVSAAASIVATIDMKTESTCDSLLSDSSPELDQGAVTGTGYAVVADEHTGEIVFVDYTMTTNETILDTTSTICLVQPSGKDIDDLAPLFGVDGSPFIFTDGFESGDVSLWSTSVGAP